MIVQADDVTGKGLFGLRPVSRHERQGVGDADFLRQPRVIHAHASLVSPGTQAQEGNSIAMTGIHVRLDLEHEAGQLAFERFDRPLQSRARHGPRRIGRKGREEFFDAEIVDG